MVSRKWSVLVFLGVSQFMVFLDVSIVNVALPSIEEALDIREGNLPYVVTAYGTLLGGCLLLGSRLADRFGRRTVLQCGLALFGLASLIAGLAGDQVVLFVSRGVQGVGAALMAPSALAILTLTYREGDDRNKALGVWGGLTGLASVAGVVLGGVVTDLLDWRWVFFVNVPVTVLALVVAPRVLPESHGRASSFDLVGSVMLTGGLLAVISALARAIEAGWGDQLVQVAGIIGVVVLVAFVGVETLVRDPLIPFEVFASRALRTANIVTVLLLGVVVTLFFFVSLFLQQVLELSPLATGFAYLPLALTVVLGAAIASGLTGRVSAKFVLLVGFASILVGTVLLRLAPPESSYWIDMLPAFVLLGTGMGIAFVCLQIAAQSDVSEERAGVAAGVIGTSQELGGSLGVAVAATIAFSSIPVVDDTDTVAVRIARTEVFHQAFVVAAVYIVVAAVVAVWQMPALTPRAQDDGVSA
ncbi:hypothetical protein CH293_16980 [Rhodococcus sp. 14-2470-1b]|uniref:MFS transporter n=1 Tax=Rhodococcus sp. 14-2470-1b TaxID=2023149 RepID=UPI000B9AB739|nr:MFS transporter [Rhodococcus sp. 14-2470-1b]OZF49548.1 hypothetical protein CH293_16980 [Rhodococcus sp. 14-2470-1b]